MRIAAFVVVAALTGGAALAHVQVLVVESATGAEAGATRRIDARFLQHAMQNGPLYTMEAPKAFGVLVNGKKRDLLKALQSKTEAGDKSVYSCRYTISEPGAHVVYLEPAPFWDAAEETMIVHYAKTIFNSCGAGLETESEMGWENWEGWDARIGFPVEIDPLVQCTSIWTGSVFRGMVHDAEGTPMGGCRIEVEYYNEDGAVVLPDPSFITQILKADAQGIFSFVPVRKGWWALTAIPEMDEQTDGPGGEKVPLEIGGVLWILGTDLQERP